MKSNHRTTFFRIACVSIVVAFGMLMPACGGGGSGGGGSTNPLTATFTASNPNPTGTNVVSMDGSSAGANFSIAVRLTNVTKFCSAAFHVTYNSGTARFVGFSATGSLLQGQGVGTYFNAALVNGVQGEVAVTANIQDASQPAGIDVGSTQELITLNFQATGTTSSNPFAFPAVGREILSCTTQGGASTNITSQVSSWDGGTMTASR